MKYDISLGDKSKVIYGGFLVNSKTGEAIFWHEPDFDVYENQEKAKIRCPHCDQLIGEKTIECFRFMVEEDVIEDLSWVNEEDWESVASFAGISKEELFNSARSEDISDRAVVYELVGSYYGFNNLDGYPYRYTASELEDMYP